MSKKILTLCCVYNDTHILLGEIKKDGQLKGRYNGFGGKVEEGEAVEEAARRELEEEAGISLDIADLKKRGKLTFIMQEEENPFDHSPIMEVHVFSAADFKGDYQETREMRPEWFLHQDIPYANMWPDDKFWLPLLLEGKNFEGVFYLANKDSISSYELKEVDFIE